MHKLAVLPAIGPAMPTPNAEANRPQEARSLDHPSLVLISFCWNFGHTIIALWMFLNSDDMHKHETLTALHYGAIKEWETSQTFGLYVFIS